MQRSDKIPKLIKILKSFVKYEWKMFDNIWEPKTSYLDASSLHEKADADNQISQALKSVFFCMEPTLSLDLIKTSLTFREE